MARTTAGCVALPERPAGLPPPLLVMTPEESGRDPDLPLRAIKAVYLSYYGVGDRAIRGRVIELLDGTELNAVVIDVKGDRGFIPYESQVPLAREAGAMGPVRLHDFDDILAGLKAKGIYAIARIVVFKDDVLARHRPTWAVSDARTGSLWLDTERLAWLDPFEEATWAYPIALAKAYMGKIAIHGFGRIGRCVLRAALNAKLFVPVSISDIKDIPTLAALFAVDTNYGRWPEEVTTSSTGFVIGRREIRYYDSSKGLPDWAGLGVDVVVDCTGRATTRSGAQAHLDRGAKRVLVSAPSKTLQDADAVLLPGINMEHFDPTKHRIVSMASCTTNALAPVVKVLKENFGIKTGFFSTVHAYTNSQSLTDQPMKDRRDSWAAAENIIPSSSGAARALNFIWSDLKITGKAYRVPVRTGSIVEVNAVVQRATTVGEVREAFRKAAATAPLKGVMDVLEEEWASTRIVGDPHSSIIDLPLVQVQEGTLVSVAAWYDNEMGYSTRLAETAAYLDAAN